MNSCRNSRVLAWCSTASWPQLEQKWPLSGVSQLAQLSGGGSAHAENPGEEMWSK
jgi:hypothetical protein